MTNQHKMTEQELHEVAQFALEARGGLKQNSMTEQQILDKTIEYLNKYSCFKNWKTNICDINKSIYITCEVEQDNINCYEMRNYLSNLLDYSKFHRPVLIKVFIEEEKFFCGSVYASEFRIAYNIIKDLAQGGTNN